MAEIKSTLDLIMEKTAGLTLSREEKAEAESREREKRARGIALRLLEGTLRPRELEAEISRAAGDDRTGFLALVGAELIRAADLGRADGPGLEEALAALFPEREAELRSALREVREEYARETARIEEAEAEKFLAELKRRGIYGSAIRPQVEAAPDQGSFKEKLLVRMRG